MANKRRPEEGEVMLPDSGAAGLMRDDDAAAELMAAAALMQDDDAVVAEMQDMAMNRGVSVTPRRYEVEEEEAPGQRPVIGREELRAAIDTLMRYKAKKQNLNERVKEDEDWWMLRHWKCMKDKPVAAERMHEPEPISAWLFNSVINKHADIMDNFPEPAIMPREQSDEKTAKALSAILPAILDRNGFETTYSECGWDKLKHGTGVYGVFWNNTLEDGLGDIDVHAVDIMSMYWEPGIKDIQDSKNLFITAYYDRETFAEMYPDAAEVKGNSIAIEKRNAEDETDDSDKVCVIDWYYRRNYGGKTILHYCKFAEEVVLFASENEEAYTLTGYYAHGRYPVVMDRLFPMTGSPAGFGYIDIMRSPQEYIDKLDASILKNVMWSARPRYFVSDGGNVNIDEFRNMQNDFVSVAGSVDQSRLMPIQVSPLPSGAMEVRQNKIEELKETSGNRDFSQGATTAGVTAASAIAALQEAGSKTSRDLNKGSYRAFSEICELAVELIRQFYDDKRSFRILGEGNVSEYVEFDNGGLKAGAPREEFGEMLESRRPVFDIKVKAQKSSPFSRLSQNELALQLYGNGIFNPDNADQALGLLDMMDFDGKDKVVERVSKNQTLAAQVRWLQQVALQAAAALKDATGDERILAALSEQLQGMSGTGAVQFDMAALGDGMKTDNYGVPLRDKTQAGKAREAATERAAVR